MTKRPGTAPAPAPLRMGKMALTWPLGAVVSRAGVDAGGVPVGMALSDVGVTTTVVGGTGAFGIWDLRFGTAGRRAGAFGTDDAGAVTGPTVGAALDDGGLVTWGGAVAAGAVVTVAVGLV